MVILWWFMYNNNYKHSLYNISYCTFCMTLALLGFISWQTLTFSFLWVVTLVLIVGIPWFFRKILDFFAKKSLSAWLFCNQKSWPWTSDSLLFRILYLRIYFFHIRNFVLWNLADNVNRTFFLRNSRMLWRTPQSFWDETYN